MTISNEKDKSRLKEVVEPGELTSHFFTRSRDAWHVAVNPANSPRTRMLCYFDAGYFAILAALDGELPLTLQEGWDFASTLELAGEKLGLSEGDVNAGVSFSEVAYDADASEPDTQTLAKAASWASRIQAIVSFRLGLKPPAVHKVLENLK